MVMLCLAPVFFTLLLENDWSDICWRSFASLPHKSPHDDQIPRTPPCSLANCIVDVCRDVVLGTGTTGRQYHQLVYRSLCESSAFNIEVPTALFQSVNAIAVMLAGVVLARLASPESRGNSALRVWLKFAFAYC